MQLSIIARPLIQALFDKTYLEQAVGNAPWGMEDGHCSYTAGCAIGRAVSKELTAYMYGSIQSVLTRQGDEDISQKVRLALLGREETPKLNDPDLRCLADIQIAHDACARNDDRKDYRPRLLIVASRYELSVPGEDELPRSVAA